jgi:DNA uptake protein ComE-like DNA-binding protein
MSAISSLPGIGKKRAASIMVARPLGCIDDLRRIIDDAAVVDGLAEMVTFE